MIFPDFDILTEFIWFLKTNNSKMSTVQVLQQYLQLSDLG